MNRHVVCVLTFISGLDHCSVLTLGFHSCHKFTFPVPLRIAFSISGTLHISTQPTDIHRTTCVHTNIKRVLPAPLLETSTSVAARWPTSRLGHRICKSVSPAKSYALGVVTSPFTLQLHHSLHCSHGCQMDMPLENPFGVHDGDGYRKAYFEEWEQAAPASPQSVHDDLSQWHTSCCPNQHMRFHHDHTLSEEELFACLTRSDPQGEGDRLCVPAGTQKLTDDGGSTPYGSPPTPQGFHLLRSRPGSPTQIQVLHRSLGSSASTWNHLTNQ